MKLDGHLAASRSATFQQIRWRWEKHFQCTGDINNASSWLMTCVKASFVGTTMTSTSNGVTHDRKLPSTLPSAASQLTSSTCTLRGVAIRGPRVAKGKHLRSIWNITVDWQGCNPAQVEIYITMFIPNVYNFWYPKKTDSSLEFQSSTVSHDSWPIFDEKSCHSELVSLGSRDSKKSSLPTNGFPWKSWGKINWNHLFLGGCYVKQKMGVVPWLVRLKPPIWKNGKKSDWIMFKK